MDMALGLAYPMISWVFYFVVPVVPAIYLVARWRAGREGEANDPQLGVKTLLYYFRTLGYHVLLAAQFCLLYGLMDEALRWEFLRIALALALAGGVVYGFHVWYLVKRSNTAQFPRVARMYNGFNLLLCGLVGTGALIVGLSAVLQESITWEVVKGAGALFVVYGSAWMAQTNLLIRRTVAQQ